MEPIKFLNAQLYPLADAEKAVTNYVELQICYSVGKELSKYMCKNLDAQLHLILVDQFVQILQYMRLSPQIVDATMKSWHSKATCGHGRG